METVPNPIEGPWFTAKTTYEGLPLYLRYPAKPQIETLRVIYPWMFNVTHELEHVTDQGLPVSEYNRSLEDFDESVVRGLAWKKAGTTVLVETFDCLRNYYGYARTEAAIDSFSIEIATKYPQHKLEWFRKHDPKWSFFQRYSKEYRFYQSGPTEKD